MTINEIAVDITSMDDRSCELVSLISKLSNELGDMFGSLQELNSYWQGPAHDLYVEQLKTDMDSSDATCKLLKTIAQSLEYSSKEYSKCESNISSMISGL